MALTCTEIGKLVHPYLDGEFSDEDRVALEQHTAECAACRDLVQYEMAFKASMRAKLSSPKASSGLRRRVLASLDEVDRLQSGSEPRRLFAWLLPTSAMAAAAAAVALFFLYPTAARQERTSRKADVEPQATAVVDQLVREHRNAMPVALGAHPEPSDQLEREMSDLERKLSYQVDVPVHLPRLRELGAVPTGAWVLSINNRRDRLAARVLYQFQRGELSVYTFDAKFVRPPSGIARDVGTAKVLCDTAGGFTKCFFEQRGVGRMFVSDDLSEDEVLRVIQFDLGSR